jgi:hypothetical protein
MELELHLRFLIYESILCTDCAKHKGSGRLESEIISLILVYNYSNETYVLFKVLVPE